MDWWILLAEKQDGSIIEVERVPHDCQSELFGPKEELDNDPEIKASWLEER